MAPAVTPIWRTPTSTGKLSVGSTPPMAHRSAPTLPFHQASTRLSSSSGIMSMSVAAAGGASRSSDPLRGLRPWAQPRVDETAAAAHRAPPEPRFKQDTPIWRPPGPSEGRAVMPGAQKHRRPPPPPTPPVELPPDDKSTQLLADELRKSASILAQAQAQMAEERALTAMRQREAEAQLGEAIELGRQEERQRNEQAVREANETLTALAEANEQGAAFVKRVERAHIAGALAEQRRGLEHELNESRLVTKHEMAELEHLANERHAREVRRLKEEIDELTAERDAAVARAEAAEEKLKDTREGRIAAYQSKAMRRMINAGLSKGFTKWQGMWEERRYHQRLLHQTQGRFFHIVPSVPGAFHLWNTYRQARFRASIEERAEQAVDLGETVQALEAQLAEERELSSRKLDAAAEQLKELQLRLHALVAEKREREELLERQMEEERQGRIRALAESAAFRVQHAGLLRGWTTWVTQYRDARDEARRRKVMREVRARLHKPALAAPFFVWREFWEAMVERQRRGG